MTRNMEMENGHYHDGQEQTLHFQLFILNTKQRLGESKAPGKKKVTC